MSLFLNLFERIYSPLTAGLLKPCRADAKLQDHKRTHLEELCGQNVRVNDIQRSGLGLESVRNEGFFRDLAELRWMQSRTQTKVLAKTRYQRPPLFWIDTIGLTGNDKAFMNVYSHNPHFDRYGGERPVGIVFTKRSNVFDYCFELHRTLTCSWRFDQVGCNGCQAGNFKLIRLIAITHLHLVVRDLIATRQARQAIDGAHEVRRWQI